MLSHKMLKTAIDISLIYEPTLYVNLRRSELATPSPLRKKIDLRQTDRTFEIIRASRLLCTSETSIDVF